MIAEEKRCPRPNREFACQWSLPGNRTCDLPAHEGKPRPAFGGVGQAT
jgi:hypothetical protein